MRRCGRYPRCASSASVLPYFARAVAAYSRRGPGRRRPGPAAIQGRSRRNPSRSWLRWCTPDLSAGRLSPPQAAVKTKTSGTTAHGPFILRSSPPRHFMTRRTKAIAPRAAPRPRSQALQALPAPRGPRFARRREPLRPQGPTGPPARPPRLPRAPPGRRAGPPLRRPPRESGRAPRPHPWTLPACRTPGSHAPHWASPRGGWPGRARRRRTCTPPAPRPSPRPENAPAPPIPAPPPARANPAA